MESVSLSLWCYAVACEENMEAMFLSHEMLLCSCDIVVGRSYWVIGSPEATCCLKLGSFECVKSCKFYFCVCFLGSGILGDFRLVFMPL